MVVSFFREAALTYGQKKSAGIHHTHLRSATTFYYLWEAYAFSASLFDSRYCSVHFRGSSFEVRNEQIKCHVPKNTVANVQGFFEATKDFEEKVGEKQ